jgi:hypothetical protein
VGCSPWDILSSSTWYRLPSTRSTPLLSLPVSRRPSYSGRSSVGVFRCVATGDGYFSSSRSSSLHLSLFANPYSVPVGVVALAAFAWLFPRPLWNEPAAKRSKTFSLANHVFIRLDLLGAVLLLGACLLLTTGLEQAAMGYQWTSAFVLPLLIASGPFAIAFFGWQWFSTTRRSHPEPVFPWRFCQSRIRFGTILNSF